MKRLLSFPSLNRWMLANGALLLCVAAPTWAQTPDAVPAPAPAFSAPSNTGVQAVGPDFKLQAGDVLAVQVANHPEMSAASVAVAANGKLNLPIVGALSAQGKTLGAVTAQIARAYSTQLRRPQVSVTLVSSVARQLVVRGAIAKPGPLDARVDLRLSEVIAGAGGLVADGTSLAGDEVQATLSRGKTAPRPLDLATALATPQSPANIVVKAGDVINISARPQVSVSLSGDAVTPATIKIRLSKNKPVVHISDVLKAGGSIKGKTEQTSGSLLRANKSTKLNVPALFDGSDRNADLVVNTGDLLSFETIEVKKINVTVSSPDHSVVTQGNYTFENEASVLRALVQAGGFAPDVQPEQVAVSVRRGARIIPVDVEKAKFDPQLDVALEDKDMVFVAFIPSPRVRLMGSVSKPEMYRLKPGATLLDALTAAGGLALPAAQTTIRILRTDASGKQTGLLVDAAHLYAMTDMNQNVRLQDGDQIFLSEARRGSQVFITGEVTTPGAVELGTSDGLAELLIKAGGPKPTAALSKLSVTSRGGGTKRFVDASPLLNGGKIDLDLQEGDYVNVPLNEASVTVMNAVAKPGKYTIPENGTLTLGDAILLAGGTAQNAKLKEVVVVHRLADGSGKPEIVPLNNLQNPKATGALAIDYQLHNGDVVWVPEGRVGPSGLAKASQSLSILGLFTRLGGI